MAEAPPRGARQVRLTVPHFMSGYILQRTDLIATVPEHLAQQLAAPFSLGWRALPVTVPGAPIHMLWHTRVNHEEQVAARRGGRSVCGVRHAGAEGHTAASSQGHHATARA